MSLDFCKERHFKDELEIAIRQEKHLSYLITSDLQKTELTSEYLEAWAQMKYQTEDHFLNFIKSIFKEKNFLLFTKFLRKPLPSAKIINTKIKPQLKRVFNAEDSDFNYVVNGQNDSDILPILAADDFNKVLFNAYFTAHNSIAICELDSNNINTPFRYLVNIKKVKSIESDHKGQISKIAFWSSVKINGDLKKGTTYIDSEKYAFYPDDEKIQPLEAPHDLGYCPAHFISNDKYGHYWVVRESIFTYIREELEEYNFLKTIQKMSEPNSTLPVTVMLDVGQNVKQSNISDPKQGETMGGQQPKDMYSTNPPTGTGVLDAGTVHKIKPEDKDGGGFDMEIIDKFIKHIYVPVEPLEFLNKRIAEIEKSIVGSLVGDIINANEESKNMMQIEKSITVLDNTLTSFAGMLNTIRNSSDTDMLNLRFGKENVHGVFNHFGTDFMIDSMVLLFDSLEKAPNGIERRNILKRITQNRYKNNDNKIVRNNLLYDLIPYVSDVDFQKAIDTQVITDLNKKFQVRFTYWISKFEAIYGDIVNFYDTIDSPKSEKLILINNILTELIIEEDGNDSTPTTEQSNIAEPAA